VKAAADVVLRRAPVRRRRWHRPAAVPMRLALRSLLLDSGAQLIETWKFTEVHRP
jgi:hypothetical protein